MARKPKLMVIDDDVAIIEIMKLNFEMRGYDVVGLPRSRESLRESLIELPDAIILDLLMPGQNGWEVLQELQENPVVQGIPVIICSVVSRKAVVTDLLQKGAAGFVAKPFDLDKLIDTVEEAMGLKRR
ncbi:MAG: response regulator [Candidatus Geothermincolia bacterium]